MASGDLCLLDLVEIGPRIQAKQVSSRRTDSPEGVAMNSAVRECSLLLIVCAAFAQSALARSYLHCPTEKVVIINANGTTSSSVVENVDFSIDEAAKSLTLADGTALTVHRFDDRWISAVRGDVSYELDRQGGFLTYASSTTKGAVTTIIIGSGRCKLATAPAK
jgi:hypothetical protein